MDREKFNILPYDFVKENQIIASKDPDGYEVISPNKISPDLYHELFKFLKTEFTFKQAINWPVRGHQFVTPELSYIRGVPLLPSIGYQTDFELQNNDLREQHNLDRHPTRLPSRVFADKSAHLGRYKWLTMRSTITTDKGQYALSQGQLLATRSVGSSC